MAKKTSLKQFEYWLNQHYPESDPANAPLRIQFLALLDRVKTNTETYTSGFEAGQHSAYMNAGAVIHNRIVRLTESINANRRAHENWGEGNDYGDKVQMDQLALLVAVENDVREQKEMDCPNYDEEA